MLIRAKYFKMIFPPFTITGSLTAITYILNTAHSMFFTIIAVIVAVMIGLSPLFIDDKKMKKNGLLLIILYSILAILAIVFIIYFCNVAKVIIAESLVSWGSGFLIDSFKFHWFYGLFEYTCYVDGRFFVKPRWWNW